MKNRSSALIALLIAVIGCTVLTGCTASTASARNVEFSDLNGMRFVSQPVAIPGLTQGTTIFLEVVNDSVSYRADCNTQGFIAGYGTEQVQPSASEIACTQLQVAVDSWLAEFIGEPPTMTLTDEELTMVGAGTTVVLFAR